MPFIPHGQECFDPTTGNVIAWVDFTTSPQGRLRNATLTVRPGWVVSWFLVDDTQTRYDGNLANPVEALVDAVQSWNLNDLGLTSYSFGMGAERVAPVVKDILDPLT